jgi:hypothetical protein
MTTLTRQLMSSERYRATLSATGTHYLFAMLWLFVSFVSVWDGYLTLLCRHQMSQAELNPVGQLLIAWNNGGVAYLLIAKLAGTIIASSWMVMLYESNPRRGLLIIVPVAAFQLWLLLFLTFA